MTAVTWPRRRLSIQRARDVHESERNVDHPFEVVDSNALVRCVDILHSVRKVEAAQPTLVEDIRVCSATAEAVGRHKAAALQRRVRDSDDLVLALEPVPPVRLVHLGLDRAVLDPGGERDRVEY